MIMELWYAALGFLVQKLELLRVIFLLGFHESITRTRPVRMPAAPHAP